METLAFVKKLVESSSKEEVILQINRAINNGPKKVLLHSSNIAQLLKKETKNNIAYLIDCHSLEDLYVRDLVLLHLKSQGYKADFCNGEICINLDSQQRTKLTD